MTPSSKPPIDWAAEERVGTAANVVMHYANAHPAAGYTNVIVNGRAATITVYWHGPVPAALRRQLAATAPRITATFRPAPYDEPTLQRATLQLRATYGTAIFTPLGVVLQGYGPTSDGRGLRVGYSTLPGRTPASTDRIRGAIQHITGVPVTELTPGEAGATLQLLAGSS